MSTRQPPLPNFEGQQPDAVRNRLSGRTDAIGRAAHLGETIVLLVEAEVVGVNHTTDKDGTLWRDHKLELEQAFELPSGDELLEEAARQAKLARDRSRGQASLDDSDGDLP